MTIRTTTLNATAEHHYQVAQSVANMTSDEVRQLLGEGKGVSEHITMPEHIALAVMSWDHFDQSLQDWAWNSISD